MALQAEPRVAPPPPRLPDRYRPLRHIASGGTASVWCAEDELLRRRVAVKLLAEPYASDPSAVRRFTREARTAARLCGHPHVVTIYDVGETAPDRHGDTRPFMVMEHLAGGTVADALRVGDVTPDDAVRWLQEAAMAIDHAHAKGVLHRDIKPANLLLDRRRVLHVTDFGIAQIGREDTLTHSGQVLGTAAYLAPERAFGKPATRASDLYALAVAAFEMLTGERPFTAASYVAQARQHLEQPPPSASERNPRLPWSVDAVLVRGMAKAPERRWPSAQAFASAVAQAMAPAHAARTRRLPAMTAVRRAQSRVAPASPGPQAPRFGRAKSSAVPAADRCRRRRAPVGLLAAGAAAAVALMVGAVDLASSGNGSPAHRRSARATAAPAKAAAPGPSAGRRPAAPTVTAVPAERTTPASSADSLEAQGHALMNGGRYASAVPVLRRAVGAAAPGSLTYAYALYDLGQALRLAGEPAAAVPVLEQRLQIPNQTATVRAALAEAERAAGEPMTVGPRPRPRRRAGVRRHRRGSSRAGRSRPGPGARPGRQGAARAAAPRRRPRRRLTPADAEPVPEPKSTRLTVTLGPAAGRGGSSSHTPRNAAPLGARTGPRGSAYTANPARPRRPASSSLTFSEASAASTA